jgi:hypothetical protein
MAILSKSRYSSIIPALLMSIQSVVRNSRRMVMYVKKIPLHAQTKALVSFQWGESLRSIPLIPARHVEKIPELFPVGQVNLEDLHIITEWALI